MGNSHFAELRIDRRVLMLKYHQKVRSRKREAGDKPFVSYLGGS